MPPTSSQTSGGLRLLIALLAIAVLCSLIVIRFKRGPSNSSKGPAAPGLQTNQAGPLAATAPASGLPPPGTLVSPEAVLGKMDQWNAAHPNRHSIFTTEYPNGSMISKMEIFSYTNDVQGATVRVKVQMFNPDMEFLGDREDGKMRIFFPRTRQLIVPNMTRELFFMPTMPGSVSRATDILKLAQSSFAEASEDREVVTLVLNGDAVGVTNEVMYLSFRINTEGELLGIDAQGKNQRAISKVSYLSFDRSAVMQDAPPIPTGFLAVSNKTLVEMMQDEIKATMPKPIRPTTI